jgi:hypothetical protein
MIAREVRRRRPRFAPGGITRNVVVLGVASLQTDVSSELLVSVVPPFLALFLVANPTVGTGGGGTRALTLPA